MDPDLINLISICLTIWAAAATLVLFMIVWLLVKDNNDRDNDNKTTQPVRKIYPQVVREWFEMQELEFEDRLLTKSR